MYIIRKDYTIDPTDPEAFAKYAQSGSKLYAICDICHRYVPADNIYESHKSFTPELKEFFGKKIAHKVSGVICPECYSKYLSDKVYHDFFTKLKIDER